MLNVGDTVIVTGPFIDLSEKSSEMKRLNGMVGKSYPVARVIDGEWFFVKDGSTTVRIHISEVRQPCPMILR